MIEVESYPSAELAGRIVEYTGLLMREKPNTLRGDRYLIGAVVVALTGRSQAGCDFRTAKGNGLFNSPIVHNLSEIDATTIMDDVEANPQLWPLLAWLPLMYGGNETTAMIRFRTMLENWPDPFQKGLLKAQTIVYAELHKRKTEWKELLKEINVIRSAYLEEIRAEAICKMILRNLNRRFGELPSNLTNQIMAIQDMTRLENLNDASFDARTLEEFTQRVS
jgi:hypothetical protein